MDPDPQPTSPPKVQEMHKINQKFCGTGAASANSRMQTMVIKEPWALIKYIAQAVTAFVIIMQWQDCITEIKL